MHNQQRVQRIVVKNVPKYIALMNGDPAKAKFDEVLDIGMSTLPDVEEIWAPRLNKGDGKIGDCCTTSEDCELICDVNSKKCRRGEGSGSGGNSCSRTLNKGDGKIGDCCVTSEDCELICDVNSKKCRKGEGNGVGGGGNGQCSGGNPGKKDGKGLKGQCCITE
ncbi:hypothetical protein BGZ90_002000, partial [Linnemannia elongata]